MSSSADVGAGRGDFPAGVGSSTEQHVTGAEETGTFLTDQAPTADTPAHGSTNAGINAVGANRQEDTGEEGEGDLANPQEEKS
jgi:hypothetical protein